MDIGYLLTNKIKNPPLILPSLQGGGRGRLLQHRILTIKNKQYEKIIINFSNGTLWSDDCMC